MSNTCLYCGKEFERHHKTQRYCNHKCFTDSTRRLKGTTRKCAICGKDYAPHYKNQKCCSDECAKKQADKTKRDLRNTAITKQCEICGQDYHPRPNMAITYTCSKACKRKRDALNKRKNGYKKRINESRQIKVSATESEYIDREAIYERDGWTCQVCGKKVKRELKYPNPMSASLDHILPFALGGSHTRANVQLAHLRCNFKKSDGGVGQLRLISEV